MRAVKYLLTLIVATALAAAAMPAMAAARSKSGPTFKYEVLYEFCALTDCADGDTPFAGPIRDAAGNLYGTTIFGGNGIYCTVNGVTGCGVVFKLDTAGNETVLYTFQGTTDGGSPYSGVIRDKAGNIYGTTTGGGNGNGPDGCGVVFKVDTNGVETVLHTFTGQSTDGCHPYARLIQDKSGNIYGTTVYGGGSLDSGVIFKVDTNGNETVLHSFTSNPDGAYPYSGLIEDEHGNFYGTTSEGGRLRDSLRVESQRHGDRYVSIYGNARRMLAVCRFGSGQGWESLRHNQRNGPIFSGSSVQSHTVRQGNDSL